MILRFAGLLLACFLLTACPGSKKKVIAVVPKGTSHLFWQSVQAGAIAAGRDLDVEVLWNGPSQETEYSRQIQIVDSMVARHVDGLAVAATDKTALSQPIERAAKAGIAVTVFDSGVDTTDYLTFVAMLQHHGRRDVFERLPDEFQVSTRAFRAHVGALLAHVPEPLRTHRIAQAMAFSVDAASDRERARANGQDVLPFAVHVSDLLDGLVGFLAAPVSATALAALEDTDPAGLTWPLSL